MEFCKPNFFLFFLPVLLIYWRLPSHGLRMGWLLAASILYYGLFNPWFIVLMFAATGFDFVVARQLPRLSCSRWRWRLVALCICVNLSILAAFKYLIFFLHSANTISSWFGGGFEVPGWKLLLPLGISFYTFEAISYLVDVYRGRVQPFDSLRDYLLYILFFPHLLAGPIVRSHDFGPQLQRPKRFSWLRFEAGVQLFLLGAFKKAVLADWMATVVDPVFQAPRDYGSAALWTASLAYSVQIYGDFSGYSDMAIGLAHMLGFKLPANFRTPYLSATIGEFWRRWHISLSNWLRDYLYIPLGGNRGGEWSTCRNLLATMTLGGLWHGANWTFVLWGIYHGLLLATARVLPVPRWATADWTRPIWILLTFLSVTIGWVLFRATSFADAATVLSGMFGPTAGAMLPWEQTALVLAGLLALFVGGSIDGRKLASRVPTPLAAAGLAGFAVLYFALIPLTASGFIYFHF
ncbi:MAG: MBOAT family protein [Gemmataceae bacterium]